MNNPFTSHPAGLRYARGRPFYHRTALNLADRLLDREPDLSRSQYAIDVGCGTGLSSRAVRERAQHVIAMDPSPAMLSQAESLDGVAYVVAAAERLPLADKTADLATVGAAFHWFDAARALAELARVLRPGAALVVYTDAFHGRLAQRPAFTDWLRGTYLPSLPTPPRHPYFAPDLAERLGFEPTRYGEQEILLPLTRSQLTDYLLSQSNAVTAIQQGAASPVGLRATITSALTSFLPDDEPTDAVFGVRGWATIRRHDA